MGQDSSALTAAYQDFFWDNPEEFVPAPANGWDAGGTARFPQSASNETVSVVAWQEVEALGGSGGAEYGNVYVSLAVAETDAGGGLPKWRYCRRAAGPYRYSRGAPWLYNLCVDRQGRIILAIAASASATEIHISEDRGLTFSKNQIYTGTAPVIIRESTPADDAPANDDSAGGSVTPGNGNANIETESLAPRIFQMTDGNYLMFIGRSVNQSLTLYYARSEDAVNWSSFSLFTQGDEANALNFLPSHAGFNGKEYIVFQSYIPGADNRITFQLFLKISSDGGQTWTAAKRITNFRDPVSNTLESPDFWNNERADLTASGGSLYLFWERKYISGTASIYALRLNESGDAEGKAERLNRVNASCFSPVSIMAGGSLCVFWFDSRSNGGSVIMMARRAGSIWIERPISEQNRNSVFACPVLAQGSLYIFWQDQSRSGSRIYYREQDRSAAPPVPHPLNFAVGKPLKSNIARIEWNPPDDPSGIRGFSWVWSREPGAVPPHTLSGSAAQKAVELGADEDGQWYFNITTVDNAGNWSPPASISFFRDTTPPPPPVILDAPKDEAGFLTSNSFTLNWKESANDVSGLAGYWWELENTGNNFDGSAALPVPKPGAVRIMGSGTSVYYDNLDNGSYRFRVCAIDNAGNVSGAAVHYLKLNKYIVRTFITSMETEQDIQGKLAVLIRGRGFAEGGNISEIEFLRKDGKESERVIHFNDGDFLVYGDREIFIPGVEHLQGGIYYVSVRHPLRGLAQSPQPVTIGRTQTVKFGNFSFSWKPEWEARKNRRFILDTPLGAALTAAVLLLLFALVSVRTLRFVAREQRALKLETAALLYGNLMPVDEKKLLVRRQKQRRRGLRFKLTLFTASLVIIVVGIVSVPLYYMMMVTERDMLLYTLYARSRVLLEALGTSARVFLPANNILELGYLPAQSASIPEARYVTITGYGEEASLTNDYVWATNDPDILKKIDTNEFTPGVSRIKDSITPFLDAFQAELNAQAAESIGTLTQTVAGLNAESLTLLDKTDAESIMRLGDLQSTVHALEDRIAKILDALNKEVRSEPEYTLYNFTKTNTFLLYKPVLFRQGSSDIYMRGMVRLEISTESINEELSARQIGIFRIILMVALGALVIGFLGALALSSIIIVPVKALVLHVEKIRDTEDKSKLEGEEITIKSKDELAVLANTINDMTRGLVRAAVASKDLTIGKEIQKKFIPLELDGAGNKKTFGYARNDRARFFGYYEGAKGVSGDYFDYRDLDGRYFAVIKCDVAGKGVPAALIMAQVATMFINYFNGWKASEKNFQIETLVYQINEFIENLGFKGRFAAFSLCLLDTETGLVRFCNAGDNIIHLYKANEKKMNQITLTPTPAAGILPNIMVRGGGGYHVKPVQIDLGDILLLYTDGIEESKRKFRNSNYEEIICTHDNLPPDSPHGNHVTGQEDEEMGADRVTEIINAVMNNGEYELKKYHNPEGDIAYHFDFSGSKGTVEEVIMALVSVEKVFRMYPAVNGGQYAAGGEKARILVDAKVDAFLKEHFLEYTTYCYGTEPYAENENYLYYTGIKEDEQYDDITILGIKRR
ncbi:MAG: SpoIIE family protein phosphatase [Spirochaetaceae bacterium]|nr:SpoIIE family protein phosphatase [Spirochaetaceae bacterium]